MAARSRSASDEGDRGRRRQKRRLAEGADWRDAFQHLLRAATLLKELLLVLFALFFGLAAGLLVLFPPIGAAAFLGAGGAIASFLGLTSLAAGLFAAIVGVMVFAAFLVLSLPFSFASRWGQGPDKQTVPKIPAIEPRALNSDKLEPVALQPLLPSATASSHDRGASVNYGPSGSLKMGGSV